jgi:pimeloyl-ACP methyl ester carboxylesterase
MTRPHDPSRPLALLLTVLASMFSLNAVSARAEAAVAVTCRDVNTPISVPGATPGAIYGRYCRTDRRNRHPLQILVPGVTYTHSYWDLPGFGGRYSYTRFVNRHGYDTLAIDRLGIGRSSRPAMAMNVTADANADALHQVVESVRTRGLGGRRYKKIVLTGHSYGTFTSDLTSATYGGVDGIVGTGWLQQPTVLGAEAVLGSFWPATMDPKFSGQVIDPGYVTTRPGVRGGVFYEASDTDPAVIAVDERTKDTASGAEATYLEPANTAMTTRIGVPTLRVIGELDRVMCNPDPCTQQWLTETAPGLFPAGVEVYAQPGAGHDVALERGNVGGFEVALSWLQRRFP